MKRILYTLIGVMFSVGAGAQTTLQEKINSAEAGATITLDSDVNLTEQVEITGKVITIDLNGHEITYFGSELSSGILLIHNGAGLTINATNGGSINSGIAMAAIALTKRGDDASNPAILVVNGGTITGGNYGITGNGSRHNTEITINGGTITATVEKDNFGIYHPQNGKLTITGGDIKAYSAAIEMRAGELNISGGAFTATATEYSCNPNGNGTTTVGAALAIAQHTTKKDIKVSISGGTFTGAKAINESNPQANDPTPQVTMAITNGTFNGEISTTDVNNFISGGTFSNPVPEQYCADGFKPTDDGNGHYGVTEKDYVALVGDVKYETIAEAIAAAQNGKTVTLLADVTDNITIPAGKSITLDLNGKTLNGKQTSKTPTIKNQGTLSVKNGNVRRTGDGTASYYVIENMGTITLDEGLDVEGSASSSLIQNNAADAKMTINAGTYTQKGAFIVVKNDLGTVEINGGTFSTESNKNVLNNWDQMTINGGTFTGNIFNGAYDTDNNKLTINDGTFDSNQIRTYLGNGKTTCPIEIKGGTFTNEQMKYVGTDNKESDADVQVAVSGGTFANPVPEQYCAEGFIPTKNDDGTYGVKEGKFVAQVGEVKYETLSAAVAAADANATITLLADIDEVVENTNANDVTIALNGKTWTSNSYTLKNNGGTITLDGDGTVKSTATGGIAVWARTGSIIIESGNYENCSNEEATIYVGTTDANLLGKKPTITINGGSFKNTAEGMYKWNTDLLPLTLNIINNIANADEYQAIVVNGGTFFGNDPSFGDDSQLGKINSNSNFVNSEKHAEYNKGVFTIEEGGYVAQTGYHKYVALDDAIDHVDAETKEVTLLTDAETEKETLPANVTIDANNKELTMSSFVVLDGEAFTLPKVTGAKTYKVHTATYIRTNISNNEWGTVCLPFSLTSGNGVTYYTYDNISGNTLTVDETTESVAPNTPVVFKKGTGDLEINQTNAIVSLVTPETLKSGSLIGTYETTDITADGSIYFINGDTFHKAQVSLKVPMYRAYIKHDSSESKLYINVSGEVDIDAIGTLTMDDAEVEATYDVAGRRIQSTQQGLNIMRLANGKTVKVMVK